MYGAEWIFVGRFDFVQLGQIGPNNWKLSALCVKRRVSLLLDAIRCTFVCTVNLSCTFRFDASRKVSCHLDGLTKRRARVARCKRGCALREEGDFLSMKPRNASRHLPSRPPPPRDLLQIPPTRYSALEVSRRDARRGRNVFCRFISIVNLESDVPELNLGNQEMPAGASARRGYFLPSLEEDFTRATRSKSPSKQSSVSKRTAAS